MKTETLISKITRLLLVMLFSCSIILFSKNLEAKILNGSQQNNYGITSLMTATIDQNIDGVRFFVKAGDSLINQKNFGGATSLHLACRQKNYEIAKILIDNNAKLNLKDKEGWTPLMRAALAGQEDIVDLLLINGADAAIKNSIGETAIHHAASSNCNECLKLLFIRFDFIKNTPLSELKKQLSDGYKITQEHNNVKGQELISAYLDRALNGDSLVKDNSRSQFYRKKKAKKFEFKVEDSEDSQEDKSIKAKNIKAKNKKYKYRKKILKNKILKNKDSQELKSSKKFILKNDEKNINKSENLQLKTPSEDPKKSLKKYNLIKGSEKKIKRTKKNRVLNKKKTISKNKILYKVPKSAIESSSPQKDKEIMDIKLTPVAQKNDNTTDIKAKTINDDSLSKNSQNIVQTHEVAKAIKFK